LEQGLFDPPQGFANGYDQIVRVARESEFATNANEKRIAKDLSETGECCAHGGLTKTYALSGPTDVAFTEERVQDDEQVQIDVAKIHIDAPLRLRRSIRRLAIERIAPQWISAARRMSGAARCG
jgi:hypothetical protein